MLLFHVWPPLAWGIECKEAWAAASLAYNHVCLLPPFLFSDPQGYGQLEDAWARHGTQPCVKPVVSLMSPLLSHLCKVCLERIFSCSLQATHCVMVGRSAQLPVQPAHLNFPSSEVMPSKADRDQYELLCTDNTRRPVDEYEQCYLARVPSHVVVARSVDGKEDLIQELLRVAQVPTSDILSSACSPLLWCVCVCVSST